MKVIGLTGGIASGKSTVSKMLHQDFGIAVIDADEIAKKIVEPGGSALEMIKEEFGPEYLDGDGGLDRIAMSDRIVRDSKAKERLEAITHPAIEHHVSNIIADYRARGKALVVYDCPLLLEARQEKFVDTVMLVTVDPGVRLNRLMERDGVDADTAQKRIDIQIPDDIKRRYADIVIENNGTKADLRRKLTKIVADWQKN